MGDFFCPLTLKIIKDNIFRMSVTKVNFLCPTDLVEKIDAEAESDFRNRTSILNKIISEYYENKPQPDTKKKKAGAR